jgi:hypothetical protein
MFCLTAVLRGDQELYHFLIRSLTPPQAAGKRSLLRFKLPAKPGVEQAEKSQPCDHGDHTNIGV